MKTIMKQNQLLEIFSVLSNKTRLNILLWLKDPQKNFPPQGIHLDKSVDLKGGVCAGSIYEKSGIAQSTISHYLDMLINCGLLLSERHGKWVYFRRNEVLIKNLKEFLDNNL